MNYFYDADGGRQLWVTVREFAMAVGVAQMTVWRWILEGMPHQRIGDRVNTLLMIPAVEAKLWAHKHKGIALP